MTVRSGKGDSGGPVFRNNGQDNFTLVSVSSCLLADFIILNTVHVSILISDTIRFLWETQKWALSQTTRDHMILYQPMCTTQA